jgi:hypothetical protein
MLYYIILCTCMYNACWEPKSKILFSVKNKFVSLFSESVSQLCVHVHLCVCVIECVHVCICACVNVCVSICVHVFVSMCMHLYVFVCAYVCVC